MKSLYIIPLLPQQQSVKFNTKTVQQQKLQCDHQQFKLLNDEKKEEVLVNYRIWLEPTENESIDSILTPIMPQAHDVMKAAG